jgi:hypothetical protein
VSQLDHFTGIRAYELGKKRDIWSKNERHAADDTLQFFDLAAYMHKKNMILETSLHDEWHIGIERCYMAVSTLREN